MKCLYRFINERGEMVPGLGRDTFYYEHVDSARDDRQQLEREWGALQLQIASVPTRWVDADTVVFSQTVED